MYLHIQMCIICFGPLACTSTIISVFGPNCIFFREVKAMKSVLFLVVHTRRHKILFLYSFTSYILQWHWHIMMLIQPCTMPALCIIKLSVSSLKPLHGISNQLSEWVLRYDMPYIILYSMSYSSTLYVYISESPKCRKNPKSPTLLATNPTKQNMGCATGIYIFCDIIAIVAEVIISWKKRKPLFFNQMNIFWPMFIFKFECKNGTCMFEQLFIVFITSCHWIKQSFWLAFIGGLNGGINAL